MSPAAAAQFADFTSAVYAGARHAPDFNGPNHRYWQFRTVIRQGFQNGRQFAGHYVLFGVGCGAGCASVTLGDLRTGKIYDFPLGGEGNYLLQFEVQPNSRLVKAHWEENLYSPSQVCVNDDLVLVGAHFIQKITSKTPGNCPNWY